MGTFLDRRLMPGRLYDYWMLVFDFIEEYTLSSILSSWFIARSSEFLEGEPVYYYYCLLGVVLFEDYSSSF